MVSRVRLTLICASALLLCAAVLLVLGSWLWIPALFSAVLVLGVGLPIRKNHRVLRAVGRTVLTLVAAILVTGSE